MFTHVYPLQAFKDFHLTLGTNAQPTCHANRPARPDNWRLFAVRPVLSPARQPRPVYDPNAARLFMILVGRLPAALRCRPCRSRDSSLMAQTIKTTEYAQSHRASTRRTDRLILLLIFICTATLFLGAHVHQRADSTYAILLSQTLLDRRSFMLDGYNWPAQAPTPQVGYTSYGKSYQLEVVGGHIYYFFPPGSSLLSLPYVALLNACGISAVNADGTYSPRGEAIIEESLAALLMAALACIFYYTSRLLLAVRWSLAVALGGALGTQVFSTASRALWSDTWGILLLGLVVLQLLTDAARRARIRPMLLATNLAWLYFVRPTYAIPILAVAVYLLLCRRTRFLTFALTGAIWAALFAGYSLYHFGRLLPTYYSAARLRFGSFGIAFAGNLISPARGLLVFVPVLFFVVYLLLRFARELPYQPLVCVAVCVCLAHLFVIAGFDPWWAGHSYGPRYTTGLVPWFVLLALLGLKAMLNYEAQRREPTGLTRGAQRRRVIGALLLALSVLINARGAMSHATWQWNVRPANVDEQPDRIWDWHNPQFLARTPR